MATTPSRNPLEKTPLSPLPPTATSPTTEPSPSFTSKPASPSPLPPLPAPAPTPSKTTPFSSAIRTAENTNSPSPRPQTSTAPRLLPPNYPSAFPTRNSRASDRQCRRPPQHAHASTFGNHEVFVARHISVSKLDPCRPL